DVAGDGDIAFADDGLLLGRIAAAHDADIGRAGRRVVVLQGAAGDGHLAGAIHAAGAVDQHVGRRCRVGRHVALDVAAGDLDVAHVALAADDTALSAIADVAARDVRLVQIDIVVIDADATVLVEVAIADDDDAVAHGQ